MSQHVIYFPDLARAAGGLPTSAQGRHVVISGEEAHHVLRVKRMEVGDMVMLTSGTGLVAACTIAAARKVRAEWEMDVTVVEVRNVPPPRPVLTVLSAAPKGDRLEQLIEGLSQVGAHTWGLLKAVRAVVEPRQGKIDRLERTAIESMKQCGRATLLQIGEAKSMEEALGFEGRLELADASGGPYQPTDATEVTLLVGPEGGWTQGELALARERGAAVTRFGPHVMRIEVAAVVAAGIIMSAAKVP